MPLLRNGINEDINDRDIWSDACWVQDQMYRHFEMFPGSPTKEDPYWKLWNHLENIKN